MTIRFSFFVLMKTRGEKHFIAIPSFAAKLYEKLAGTKANIQQFVEMAKILTTHITKGRILDIGTGPGKLLKEINTLNPKLELFGLDISTAMVELAKKSLSPLPVDLRQGTIQKTPYNNNYFNLVTCSGSFYIWDYLEASLDEIFRILKSGCKTLLFESFQEYNKLP